MTEPFAQDILEIGLLASHSGDVDAVAEAVVRRLLAETGACMAGIALIDSRRRELLRGWSALSDGTPVPVPPHQPLSTGIVGSAALSGLPRVVDDVRTCPDYVELLPGVRSEVAVPLKVGGKVIAVLDVESRTPGRFPPEMVARLESVAAPVALAIQNARLIREERHRSNQLALVNRVSRILTSSVDLDDLLRRAVDAIREQLGYDMVAVGLVDDARQEVTLCAVSTRVPLAVVPGHALPLGHGITGEVVRTGTSLLVPDVREWDNYAPAAPHIQCEMCVPLLSGGRPFGFLDAESTEIGKFDDHDRLLLEALGDHVSQAIENARNRDRIERLREDLTGMLVHDLRTPLTVVRSSVDLLAAWMRRHVPSPEPLPAVDGRPSVPASPIERYFAQARSGCEEMMLLIGGLLDLQKLEAGELRPRIERCAAGDPVRAVVERLSVVADARQIALGASIGENLPAAELDVDLVTRVLENLVANALKFTPPGGRVQVELGPAEPGQLALCPGGAVQGLSFVVRDTGPGIPGEERERIFEKFAVVESRRAGRRYSTGLGLAFCRAAVRAHGGAIWVDDAPGGGSAFHVVLPAAQTPPRASVPPLPPVAGR
ncbi:MAG: GAF domain-containing protein [Deltaproteobacteria bacterium]|nr:GAF domain-containing protein [Deltaproteobacteria bacterium]